MLPKRKGGQSSKDLFSFLFAHTFHPYSIKVSYTSQAFLYFFPKLELDRRAFKQVDRKKKSSRAKKRKLNTEHPS